MLYYGKDRKSSFIISENPTTSFEKSEFIDSLKSKLEGFSGQFFVFDSLTEMEKEMDDKKNKFTISSIQEFDEATESEYKEAIPGTIAIIGGTGMAASELASAIQNIKGPQDMLCICDDIDYIQLETRVMESMKIEMDAENIYNLSKAIESGKKAGNKLRKKTAMLRERDQLTPAEFWADGKSNGWGKKKRKMNKRKNKNG